MVEGAETLNRALLEGLTADEARDVGRVVGEELASADASVRAFLVTLVAAAWALRRAERDGGGGIRSFGDALWCAFNALTTTGESGCPPVTGWGRVVAGALMLVGTPLYTQVQGRVARMVGRLAGGEPGAAPRPPVESRSPVEEVSPSAGPWTFTGATTAPVAPSPPSPPVASPVLDALLERVKAAGDLMARTQGLVMKVDASATANRHLLERVAERAAATGDVEAKLDAILELLRAAATAAQPPSLSSPPPPPPAPLPGPAPTAPASPILSQVLLAAAARAAAPPAPSRPSLAEQLRAAAGPLAAAVPPVPTRSAPAAPVAATAPAAPSAPPRPSKGHKQKRRRK